ncbi:MAG: hypothetical protein ABI234_17285 [Ktedonobacteraceae bacterium]
MRQSDGSEILGPNDPRTIVIGIIHVTPGDDRQSVLTAISTQEKLGRDQIVLELPAQNKAFKNAVDFEGLRQMAGEIEATLVLVVPARSKIATYAKKERFVLYSSLDELTTAEFPPLQPDGTEQAAPVEDDTADHAITFPITPLETPVGQADVLATTSTATNETLVVAQNQPLPDVPETPTEDVADEKHTAPLVEDDEAPTNPGLAAVSAQTAGQVEAQHPADDADDTLDNTQPQAATIDATGALGGTVPATLASGTGALVPAGSLPPTFYYEQQPEPPRRRSWRNLIITAAVVLLLIVMGVAFNRPILDLFFPPTATVTIIPNSQRLQHTYQITAVLGLPDPSKDQVDARAIYASSQPQSSTARATGQGTIPGQQARGVLTFYNISTSPQAIPAGTVIFDPHNSNVVVVNDDALTLPGFDPSQRKGITDNAHTLNVGSNQNIPGNDITTALCCGGTVYVSNLTAFSGGLDPQTFAYVQQSDIDSAAQGLEATLNGQTTQILQGQTRSNERPVGQPRCAPQVQSTNMAGTTANTVTVMVTMNCLGEVYDMQAVQILTARKLMQDASVNPGPAYAPVGNVVAQVAKATPAERGDVLLTVNALGMWAYQFSNTQRTSMARLIAGQSSQNARAKLLQQPGVHDVAITLSGVGVTTVPGDVTHITLNVEAVQGLHV